MTRLHICQLPAQIQAALAELDLDGTAAPFGVGYDNCCHHTAALHRATQYHAHPLDTLVQTDDSVLVAQV